MEKEFKKDFQKWKSEYKNTYAALQKVEGLDIELLFYEWWLKGITHELKRQQSRFAPPTIPV